MSFFIDLLNDWWVKAMIFFPPKGMYGLDETDEHRIEESTYHGRIFNLANNRAFVDSGLP